MNPNESQRGPTGTNGSRGDRSSRDARAAAEVAEAAAGASGEELAPALRLSVALPLATSNHVDPVGIRWFLI